MPYFSCVLKFRQEMNRLYHPFGRISWMRVLSQSLLLGCLTIGGLVGGSLIFGSKADAQSPTPVDNTQIVKYSRALLGIEPVRQEAFDEIKKIVGDREIPKTVCNDPNSINALPNKARDIAVNYCNRSQKIVQENGLTTEQFNSITVQLQNNEDLKRQIYNTLIRLQKNPDAR